MKAVCLGFVLALASIAQAGLSQTPRTPKSPIGEVLYAEDLRMGAALIRRGANAPGERVIKLTSRNIGKDSSQINKKPRLFLYADDVLVVTGRTKVTYVYMSSQGTARASQTFFPMPPVDKAPGSVQ